MSVKYKISIDQLQYKCDTECFKFDTTEELESIEEIIGQNRALEALDFGLEVKGEGYNIFVAGESGTGRSSYVNSTTNRIAKDKNSPNDWMYVNNFKVPHRPIAISLKSGEGKRFAENVEQTIDLLQKEIKNVFSSKKYENLKAEILFEYDTKYETIMKIIDSKAEEYGFRFEKLKDNTIVSIPLVDGKDISDEEVDSLSQEELDKLKNKSSELNLETVELFNEIRILGEVLENDIKNLDKQTASQLAQSHVNKLKEKYKSEDIQKYLNMLVDDIVENVDNIKDNGDDNPQDILGIMEITKEEVTLDRYKVNLFMVNGDREGAPVVYETNPTYHNLIGSIEYTNEMGVMKTDFMQIKPGALHMANGGYLILQAKDLLMHPFAWEALKRSLKNNAVNIESLESQVGSVITSTLKPKPIPLDLKVILIGDYYTYSLLYDNDEDFGKLFKVMADFDTEMDKSSENLMKMARFIATHCRRKNLRHFDKDAVYKILEYSSKIAESQNKLSSKFNQIVEIIYESDYWANKGKSEIIKVEHVKQALDKKIFRNNKYEEKILEMFKNEDYLLDVAGKKIGEINGLAVLDTGEYAFGKPSKITVSTYIGESGIINIEREVKSSGKMHDKGVMIISGYLGAKYAKDKPLALTASVVFEQLYSGVDGDSASSTELYAIISSISEIPINQGIAVTGSVNQRGEIQPIGGVNEKIEGFYKVCKIKGLTGKQGVMIPHQNVKNLMLSDEVTQAIRENKFSVYSVKTIDQGIEILTGVDAETVHCLVNKKLEEASELENKEQD